MSLRTITKLMLCLAPALAACAASGQESTSDTDGNIGTAIAEIRLVPPDVKCINFTITNTLNVSMRQYFGLSGAANATFALGGLYLDTDQIVAWAYNVPCALAPNTTPTWGSNAVTVAVANDPPVSVVLTMKTYGGTTGGRATVFADFPTPRGVITEFTVPTANTNPAGITTGPDGNLWFTEKNTHAIGVITPTGTITETVISGGQPNQILAGADGNVWFTDDAVNLGIAKMVVGGLTRSYPQGGRTGGIAVGNDGNVWFTNLGTNSISNITPAGVVRSFAAAGVGAGLANGPDGNLWFTNGAASISMMTMAGAVTSFALPHGGWPDSLVAGPDSNLWYTENASSMVGRITTAGVITEFPIAGSKGASHLAVGPDGNLWFAESTLSPAIARITPAGTITEFKITGATCAPTGITAGPDGNVWFTEGACNKIGRITP